tara:strand:+ start:348 stop:1157 length:810 start_codon:yes stop_codon:yes gene_type:complete
MKFINRYSQLLETEDLSKKLKNIAKSFLINNILPQRLDKQNEFIIYPFWHHVFDDEVQNFKSQINLMKNYGDFISYDDSISILEQGLKPKERYFCLSFDDGFKNIFNNVIDIFLKDKIPCMFFIPTSFIDNLRVDSGKVFFNRKDISINFLSWNDCRRIVSENIFDIGSHSVNHNLISKLSLDESMFEIVNSKQIIENKLNIKCNHFAPPVGDYSIKRDLKTVKNSKFKSLSTTIRGKMTVKDSDVFMLKRQHLLANWDLSYLKYFFSK